MYPPLNSTTTLQYILCSFCEVQDFPKTLYTVRQIWSFPFKYSHVFEVSFSNLCVKHDQDPSLPPSINFEKQA